MPAPAWVFFNADSEPLGDPALAVFQCGHGCIQNHGQQDAQQYINAAVLLEQDRGRNDGNAEHGGSGPHPAAAGRFKNVAAVIGHHQGDRVEHMDGGADIEGRVGGIEHPHGLSKEVAAVHPVGPQIQPGGQDDSRPAQWSCLQTGAGRAARSRPGALSTAGRTG